jgi:enamine deaminase RidA (YjgF/YER057c/UK114 family)
MSADAKLKQYSDELPPPAKPAGVYRPAITVGKLVYTSGHGPLLPNGDWMTGKVGEQVDQAGGYQAARQTGLSILATLQDYLGSLDKIKRVIKTLGMVNCVSSFSGHPAVINGCSEFFREVFGDEKGVGARSAVGMSSLPSNITTEIEVIFELE